MLRLRQGRRLRQQRIAREQQNPPHLEAESSGRPCRRGRQDHEGQGLHALPARRKGPARSARSLCCVDSLHCRTNEGSAFGAPLFLRFLEIKKLATESRRHGGCTETTTLWESNRARWCSRFPLR